MEIIDLEYTSIISRASHGHTLYITKFYFESSNLFWCLYLTVIKYKPN